MHFSSKGILFISIAAVGIAAGGFLFLGNFELRENAAISPTPTSAPATENQIVIRMTKDGFLPNMINAAQSDIVTFINEDKKARWPASNIHPTHQIYAEFDPLKPVPPGESWSFVFNKPGRWRFHDHLFSEFTGEIIVSGATESSEKETKSPSVSIPSSESQEIPVEFSVVNMLELAKSDEKIRFWMGKVGPERMMQKLLIDSGGGSTIDCHQESHNIGRIAYDTYGPSVFSQGDASCHSGFYHGAMEAFLSERGTANLAQNISEICSTFATSFGRFECLHGVGHGVIAFEDYDLPQAIKTCGELGSDYERSSCYGGMFMENIVSGQGLGAIRGHDTKWVSQDPQFPCNSISQDYNVQFQCWQMQTSWMLTLFKYDFDLVRDECLRIRPDMISVCFKSLGRDAAGHTLRNPHKIVEICNKVPREGDYYSQCLIGAVNVIVDFWGDKVGNKASELCKMAPEHGKKACYSTLYSRLFDVFANIAQRKFVCSTFEEEYKSYCNTL